MPHFPWILFFLLWPDIGHAEEEQQHSLQRIKARHILIAFQGALQAPKNIRRNREDAEQKAIAIQKMILQGENFAKLARKQSDGPSGPRGGELGVFERGVMHKAFEERSFGLKEQEIGMVETDFGFHIIQRQPLIEVNLTHVVIQWKKSKHSKSKRSKEAALVYAKEAHTKLTLGSNPNEIAKEYSDGPYGLRGGDVGWFQKGELNPILDKAAFSLQTGAISDVLETSVGYHILIRKQ